MTAFIKLTAAMELFEDETLELSFTERLNLLRQAFIVYQANHLKRIAEEGNKSTVTDNEKYVIKEGMKALKSMEQLHNAQVKANKAAGKTVNDKDLDWLKEIKNSKSSIGSIFQDLKEKSGENKLSVAS